VRADRPSTREATRARALARACVGKPALRADRRVPKTPRSSRCPRACAAISNGRPSATTGTSPNCGTSSTSASSSGSIGLPARERLRLRGDGVAGGQPGRAARSDPGRAAAPRAALDEVLQRLMNDADALEQLLQKVIERLTQEGFLRASRASRSTTRPGAAPSAKRGAGALRADREGRRLPGLQALRDLLAPSASRPSGGTTRAISRPASRLGAVQALRVRGHDEPRRARDAALGRGREGLRVRWTSATRTCASTSPNTSPPAPRSSCWTARTA